MNDLADNLELVHANPERPAGEANAAHPVQYRELFSSSPMERIALVKAGMPAGTLITLARDMAAPRELLYRWLGLARTTANRKVRADERLDLDDSERVLDLARLIGQVEQIVAESGDAAGFSPAKWTASWLQTANPALNGRQPGEFMDTTEGRALVANLVARMQSGAYA